MGYTILMAGKDMAAGLMALPAEAAGAPPHWMGHVAVDDIEAIVAQAQKLGAAVHVPPREIPDMGRFAVLADPQGALFGVLTPEPGDSYERHEKPGHFGWAELNTTDYEAAWRFYAELIGWKPTRAMDMGPGVGTYFMFGLGSEESTGGMSNAATMMQVPAHWVHYIHVVDLDATLARVTEKGGRVLNGPMEVPGGDRIAQCMDPQGALFAVYGSTRI